MNRQTFRITSTETYEKQRGIFAQGHEIDTEALDDR